MDAHLVNLNAAACLVLSLLAGWAVISPRVRDGILIKLGLILVAVGASGMGLALATGDPTYVVLRALGLHTAGLFVVALGVLWRARRPGAPKRRASDWVALDTLPAEG